MLSAEIAVARGLSLAAGVSLKLEDQENIQHLETAVEAACSGGPCLDDRYTVPEHCREVAAQLTGRIETVPNSARRGAALACVESICAELAVVAEPTDERRLPSIDALLDFAIAQTEEAYASLPAAPTDAVGIRFDIVGGRDALTTFDTDAATGRSADVMVGIPSGYRGALYFGELTRIQHEVFVHSVQGLRSGGRRRTYGPTCPVAEGLVDTAAHRSLMRAIENGRLPDDLAKFASVFRREAASRHGSRFGNRPGLIEGERMTQVARQGGQALFDAVMAARGGKEREDYAIKFAMAVNVLDLDAGTRRDFAADLRLALEGSNIERRRAFGVLDDVIYRPERATSDFFANAL